MAADSPLGFEAFCAAADVSRETGERLGAYLGVLETWQARINLVGKTTLADPWRRHFLDSAQLHPLMVGSEPKGRPETDPVVVDLGSGAGFPGLVLAIMGGLEVHLVESDGRKCAFLREAARASGARITLHNSRIETIDPAAILGPGRADWVTARACAPLDRLLGLAAPFLGPGGRCLFLKGAAAARELTVAEKTWKISSQTLPSQSDPRGVILKLTEISRAGS